jgi:hypothetical protein
MPDLSHPARVDHAVGDLPFAEAIHERAGP